MCMRLAFRLELCTPMRVLPHRTEGACSLARKTYPKPWAVAVVMSRRRVIELPLQVVGDVASHEYAAKQI